MKVFMLTLVLYFKTKTHLRIFDVFFLRNGNKKTNLELQEVWVPKCNKFKLRYLVLALIKIWYCISSVKMDDVKDSHLLQITFT